MDRWKSRGGKSQRREEPKRDDQQRERVRRKKMQVGEEVGKTRNTVFLSVICGFGRSKTRPAKAAGAETSGQMRDEQVHIVVERRRYPSQNGQTHHVRRTF